MVLELDTATLIVVLAALSALTAYVSYLLGWVCDPEWERGREWGRVVGLGAFVVTVVGWVRADTHAVVLAAVIALLVSLLVPRSSERTKMAAALLGGFSFVAIVAWLTIRTQGGLYDPAVLLAAALLGGGLLATLTIAVTVTRHFPTVLRAYSIKAAQRHAGTTVASLLVPCLWLSVRPGGRVVLLSIGLVASALLVVRVSSMKLRQYVLPSLAAVSLIAAISYMPVTAEKSVETPIQTGALASSPYGEAFDKCALITTDYLGQKDCYSEYFVGRTEELGVDGTLDLLVQIHQDNVNGRSFLNHCHEVLHDIAKNAAKKYGVETLFGSWVVTCTGGFAHGVLSEYVHGQSWEKVREGFGTFCEGMTKKVVDAIVAKGKPAPSDTGWIDWNCNHMIGHIAYENNRTNVPETAKLCLSWPVGDTRWRNCGAGMFMEYYLDMTRGLNGVSLPRDPKEIHSLCRQLDKDIQEPCYSESGAAVWQYNSGTAAGAFGLCKQLVPAGEMLEACYGGVSRMVTVANGFVPSKMNAACISGAEVDPIARDLCGNEVAGSLVMETNAPDEAMNTCKTVVLTEELYKKCEERVNSVSSQINGSGLGGGTGAVSE